MAQAFDPYHKWLGIGADEQPPNRYRLLGIRLFETDPDVIENAADRQMAYLRTFQRGPNFESSQALLSEIASARLTLLDRERKAAYDAKLKGKIESPIGRTPPQGESIRRLDGAKPEPQSSTGGAANDAKASSASDGIESTASKSQPATEPPRGPLPMHAKPQIVKRPSPRRREVKPNIETLDLVDHTDTDVEVSGFEAPEVDSSGLFFPDDVLILDSPESVSTSNHSQKISCPYCLKPFLLANEHIGRVVTCPHCHHRVQAPIPPSPPKLTTTWFYLKEGIIEDTEIGPLDEDAFLHLVDSRKIKRATLVHSPEATANQWYYLREIDLTPIRNRIRQALLSQREQQARERASQQRANANRILLVQTVRAAVADGVLTQDEVAHIYNLAGKFGIAQSHARGMILDETTSFINSQISQALEDGVLSPDEEQSLATTARNLCVNLSFHRDTEQAMARARRAWRMLYGSLESLPTCQVPIKLARGEACYALAEVTWNERRSRRRHANSGPRLRIRLMPGVSWTAGSPNVQAGAEQVMTRIDEGTVYLTNMGFLFIGSKGGKSMRFKDILRIRFYDDGFEIIKPRGKSPLLVFRQTSEMTSLFSILARRFMGES